MRGELWMQISAGQGPAECAWAVVQVAGQIEREAVMASIECRAVEIEPGPQPGTARSILLGLAGGADLAQFAASWRGTIQWIARSPFRPQHRRRNWFVGVEVLEPVEEAHFEAADLQWETMRASGPGGQHVNRTESAVRVTHLPTGLQASAAEERSQHRNRKLALARLERKLREHHAGLQAEVRDARWRAHHELERGNAVRVFRGGG